MPILTTIRQSPAYLYLKTYCLCAIVTLFQTAPVSSRLPQIHERPRLDEHQIVASRLGPRIVSSAHRKTSPKPQVGEYGSYAPHGTSDLFIFPRESGTLARRSSSRNIPNRWLQRVVDLAQIKKLLRDDDKDARTYPEINCVAAVRHSSSLHPEEQRFIRLRKRRISSRGNNSLHCFLGLPEDDQVDPRDVPLIALGGSGGGYRAMYGFTAFISASKKLGLWDCLTWTAGVSGSCWTLAAYYTIAKHDVSRLIQHYLSVAKESTHPMSLQALDAVAWSPKGVYFLIGPLLRKVRSGIIGLRIMDLYGTLKTTYQLLSREQGAGLSRATFQFSKVWTRSDINKGVEPMPIFTAARRAPKDSPGVKPHTDSSLSRGRPPIRALTQHQTKASKVIAGLQHEKSPDWDLQPTAPPDQGCAEPPDSSLAKGFFQWFEISPLEIGSPDVPGYIPTWSWGRSFVSGRSFGRHPEQSLSLLLGQCTSAPAGPLTGYISALLASMPKGTVMSRLLLLLNDFVRMKHWERLWGNPIRAGHDPNPFYGHNNRPQPQAGIKLNSTSYGLSSSDQNPELLQHPQIPPANVDVGDLPIQNPVESLVVAQRCQSNFNFTKAYGDRFDLDYCDDDGKTSFQFATRSGAATTPRWESEGRIRLMDSGMSNNLPSHILARPQRCADIIVAFDASSDVQKGSAIQRIQNFAEDCHIELEDQTALFDPPEPHFHAGADGPRCVGPEVETKFLHQYSRVFQGKRENGQEIYLVYCPLLPNGGNPGFDPSVSNMISTR